MGSVDSRGSAACMGTHVDLVASRGGDESHKGQDGPRAQGEGSGDDWVDPGEPAGGGGGLGWCSTSITQPFNSTEAYERFSKVQRTQ